MEKGRLDYTLEKPVSFWFKEVSFDGKKFFTELGKGVVDFVMGKSENVVKDAIGMLLAFSPKGDCIETAWTLVIKALGHAMANLVREHRFKLGKSPDEREQEAFAKSLEALFTQTMVAIRADFLHNPKEFALLPQVTQLFQEWLELYAETPLDARHIARAHFKSGPVVA